MLRLMLLFFLWVLIAPEEVECYAQANTTNVQTALQASVNNQDWKRQDYSLRVNTEFALSRGDGNDRQRTTALVRTDGARLDVAGDFAVLDPVTGEPKTDFAGNYNYRRLSNGRWWFVRETRKGAEKTTGARSSEIRAQTNRAIESHQYGFGLDGHFPGNNGKTLVELLVDCDDLTMTPHTVGGSTCVKITGATTYGEVEVCLDPDRGFAIVAARHRKLPDSQYDDKTVAESFPTRSYEEWSAELSNVSLERVADYYIPTVGKIVVEEIDPERQNKFVLDVSRSEIDLSPTFAGTDAFEMDFVNGARIASWDLADKHMGYIWNNGEMVAEDETGITGVAVVRSRSHTNSGKRNTDAGKRTWILILVNVGVLLALVALYFFKRRNRSQ